MGERLGRPPRSADPRARNGRKMGHRLHSRRNPEGFLRSSRLKSCFGEHTVGTIFNDFLGLYTGERPVGIHELIQKYDRHPVLMGLLSNVDSVIYVDVKKAMYEIYPFYKKYRHRALDDSVWKDIVESAEALEKKWNGNLWVRRVMLNLVNELDKESQEMQREAAGGNVENHASKAA